MIVMPSNHGGAYVRELASLYPGRLANLYSPDGWRTPTLPYALDNGAYTAFLQGRTYVPQHEFLGLCEKAVEHVKGGGPAPLWLVVPDVVGNRDQTLWNWEAWWRDLRSWYGWPLAFALQDGMTAADVPAEADLLFLGGSTRWKRRTLLTWCHQFPRVHVGRINTYRWLWIAAEAGAESIDGTGWFYNNDRQKFGLQKFLAEWEAGHRKWPGRHPSLFDSEAVA